MIRGLRSRYWLVWDIETILRYLRSLPRYAGINTKMSKSQSVRAASTSKPKTLGISPVNSQKRSVVRRINMVTFL